jgi:hypothetical protein
MLFGVQRERDPNLINLEINIFNSLKEVADEEDIRVGFVEKGIKPNVSSLSVEDAIKELIVLYKDYKINHGTNLSNQ